MIIEYDKIKLTAITIGSVIFFAYLKQYLFYDYYGIDISNYILISEVLTPFLDELALWCIFLFLFAFSVFAIPNILFYSIDKLFNKTRKNNNEINQSNLNNNLANEEDLKFREEIEKEDKYSKKVFKIYSLILFVLQTHLIISEFIENKNLYKIYLITFVPTWLTLVFSMIYANYRKVILAKIDYLKKNNNFKQYQLITYTLLLFIATMTFVGFIVGNEIKYKMKNEVGDKKYVFNLTPFLYPIKSDSLNIYLGRTSNNFFIYNLKEKTTTVYNTSDIITEQIIILKQ